MKRIFALFTALVMLIAALAAAEEPAFQLENGLRWGMTQEEIFALFGEENALAEPMYDGVDTIQYVLDNRIPDDDCEISLSMVLVDGELAMIMYDLLRVDDPAVKEGCIANMTGLFGEPIDGGMDRFMASFGLLAGWPEMTAADIGAQGTGVSWDLSDGTYMGVYDMTNISFGVYFVNEPRFAPVAEYYAAVPTADYYITDDGDLVLASGEVIGPTEPPQMPGFDEFITLAPTVWGLKMDEVIEAASLSNFEFRSSEDSPIVSIYCEAYTESTWLTTEYVFNGDALIMQKYSYAAAEGTDHPDPAAALTGLYGASVVTEPEKLLAILNASGVSAFASVEEMQHYGINGDTTWYADDGSFILLTGSGDSFVMYHISSTAISAAH